LSYIGNKPANKAIVASDLDPAVITGQTALGATPADTDEFIISDAGVLKRMDYSHIKAGNTPAFEAYLSADSSALSNDTATKIEFNTEIYDSDSTYDNSTNYRFTPAVAGKYFVYGRIEFYDSNVDASDETSVLIYKNGSQASIFNTLAQIRSNGHTIMPYHETLDLDDDDYVEIYGKVKNSDGSRIVNGNGATVKSSTFGAFKIG
jgi:hypothetical protein